FTMCFLMIYYAFNPQIEYNLIVPKGESSKLGFFSWIFGANDWEMVKMTGGLMLASFMDLTKTLPIRCPDISPMR
ncbi:MAG: hypothetical protein EBW01_05475, partial [Proteobacteria bacterium]|nr:hypothetical protein [Pseudomonadota bacterium]